MDRSQNQTIEILADPRNAVEYLRSFGQRLVVSWNVISDLITLHCEGSIPQLALQLRHHNATGLATWLEELADEETRTLPERMAADTNPLSSLEAERAAYRIALLRALASAARSLHGQEYTWVGV